MAEEHRILVAVRHFRCLPSECGRLKAHDEEQSRGKVAALEGAATRAKQILRCAPFASQGRQDDNVAERTVGHEHELRATDHGTRRANNFHRLTQKKVSDLKILQKSPATAGLHVTGQDSLPAFTRSAGWHDTGPNGGGSSACQYAGMCWNKVEWFR